MMVKTGQKPGIGEYECINCRNNVRLDDDTDRMPPCGNCHNTEFEKI